MQLFNCNHCDHLVFFDSDYCLNCGATLAFLPESLTLVAVEPAPNPTNIAGGLWQRKGRPGQSMRSTQPYRMCHNRTAHKACNFAVAYNDKRTLCVACRQTRTIPDLSVKVNVERFRKAEDAKRRLFFTLSRLGLGLGTHAHLKDPEYDFLVDMPGKKPVMTGHMRGVITVNLVEADDVLRAKNMAALGEPYRTLLGHLRHEVGHFYWDVLARDPETLEGFRDVFGDERQDYGKALKIHYARSEPPANWHLNHVSAYATCHPWEDWAETWAHYLHMMDLLETAASYHATVTVPDPERDGAPHRIKDPFVILNPPPFQAMVAQWIPLTLMLNSLTRSLGQIDAYPFALSPGAIAKLRFIHEWVRSVATPRRLGEL